MKKRIRRIILYLISKMQSGLDSIRRKVAGQDFHAATEQDIYYYYRLFLNREPDPQGLQTYKDLVNYHGVSIDHLTDAFLYCNEMQEIQEKRDQPILVELPDFQLYVRLNDRFIGAAIAEHKLYEAHVTNIVRELLYAGCTFLDIGANIGYFLMLAASHLKNKGRVIAFEPVEQNRELFTMSMQANNFQNIELHPYAVSDTEQTFALDIGGKNSNSRIISVDQGAQNKPLVTAVPLDNFLPDLPALDIIKMDIEGAEPLALKGMSGLIQKFHPTIISEFSPAMISLTSQVEPISYLDQLVNLGYTLSIIDGRGRENNPLTPQQILTQAENTPGLAHLDLLAVP